MHFKLKRGKASLFNFTNRKITAEKALPLIERAARFYTENAKVGDLWNDQKEEKF